MLRIQRIGQTLTLISLVLLVTSCVTADSNKGLSPTASPIAKGDSVEPIASPSTTTPPTITNLLPKPTPIPTPTPLPLPDLAFFVPPDQDWDSSVTIGNAKQIKGNAAVPADDGNYLGISLGNRTNYPLSGKFQVTLTIDERFVKDWFISDIDPHSRVILIVPIDYIVDNLALQTGEFTVLVQLDSSNQFQELNEQNNEFTGQLMIQARLPDLVPFTPIKFGWDAPMVIGNADLILGDAAEKNDDATYIGFSLTNQGKKATSQGIFARLWIDEKLIKEWTLPDIQPLASHQWHIRIDDIVQNTPLRSGLYEVFVEIDPFSLIIEHNERDNWIARELEIIVQLPDLALITPVDRNWPGPLVIGNANLVLPEGIASDDTAEYVGVAATNLGSQTARDIHIRLHSDGINIHEWLVPILKPNDVLLLWKSINQEGGLLLAPGFHDFQLSIDSPLVVAEENETNNNFSALLEVQSSFSIRTSVDRPDDTATPTIHVIYLLSPDTIDQLWDQNGFINDLVRDTQLWFGERTGGYQFRFDTYQGQLDTSFVLLEQPLSTNIGAAFDGILTGLETQGFEIFNKFKVNLIIYPGLIQGICGVTQSINLTTEPVWYGEAVVTCMDQRTVAHELMHALGGPLSCAPHYELGHVNDHRSDLMYERRDRRTSEFVDFGNDDYFNHTIEGCWDVADSPFLISPDQNLP
jgi:hypothetical protein